jgi:hypothetical protein
MTCIKNTENSKRRIYSATTESTSHSHDSCGFEQLEALEDEPVLLGQPVDAVIALSHPPARTPQSIRLQDSGSSEYLKTVSPDYLKYC